MGNLRNVGKSHENISEMLGNLMGNGGRISEVLGNRMRHVGESYRNVGKIIKEDHEEYTEEILRTSWNMLGMGIGKHMGISWEM